MATVRLAIQTGINPSFESIGGSTQFATTITIKGLNADEKNAVNQVHWEIYEQTAVSPVVSIKTNSAGSLMTSQQIISSSKYSIQIELPMRKYFECRFRLRTNTQGWGVWTTKFQFKTRNADYRLPSFRYSVNVSGKRGQIIERVSKEIAYSKQANWENRLSTTVTSQNDDLTIIGRCDNTINLSVYNAATTSDWTIGTETTSTTGFFTGSDADAVKAYPVYLQKLPINGIGTYTLIDVKALAGITNVNVDEMTWSIWKLDAGTFTRLDFEDITASMPSTASVVFFTHTFDTVDELSFTVDDSSASYFVGLGFRKLTGASSSAGGTRYLSNDTVIFNTTQVYRFTNSGESALPTSLSAASANNEFDAPLIMDLTLRTTVRTVYEVSAPVLAEGYLIPRRQGSPYFIKLEDVNVTDTNTLTFVMYESDAGGDPSAVANAIMDLAAPDAIQFGPALSETSIALNATHREAGDDFDLGIDVRPSVSRMDLFYLNKDDGQGQQSVGADGGTDIATISHWAKDNSTAPSLDTHAYSIGSFNWIQTSGTGTTGKIQVGYDPLILIGDSQVGGAGGVFQRLGLAWPTSFTHNRIIWQAGISGGRLTNTVTNVHTRADHRYENVAGQGDLAYMKGVIFVLSGIGVNDASFYGVDLTTAKSNLTTSTQNMLDDMATRGNTAILLGNPPVPGGGTAGVDDILVAFNTILHTEAVSRGLFFYNPYPEGAVNLLAFADGAAGSIFDGSGVHYNTSGAASVVANAVAAYEANSMKLFPDC